MTPASATPKAENCLFRQLGVYWVAELVEAFGGKLIFMLFCTNHLVKGFNYTMMSILIRYFFQDMGVDGPSIDRYQSIAMMPWAMKPLIGILSDSLPIGGYKKRPYLMFCHVLGVVGAICGAFINLQSLGPAIGTMTLFLCSLQWMACDIFAEAIYSRRMAENPTKGPDLLAYVWGGNQLLAVAAALLSGVIIEQMDGIMGMDGSQWALATCLIPSVIVVVPTILNFLGEVKVSKEDGRQHRNFLWGNQRVVVFVSLLVGFGAVFYAVAGLFVSNTVNFILIWVIVVSTTGSAWFFLRPVIGKLILFNTISYCTNLSIGGAAQYFFTDTPEQYPEGPNFSPQFYSSVLQSVGTVCCVVAIFLYNRFMKDWRYRNVYTAMILFATAMQMTNPIVYSRLNVTLGIPDKVFMVGDTALVQASSILYQMPGFLIMSHMCPKNMEATMFALIAALSNFVINCAAPIAGYICEGLGVTPDGSLNESDKFDNLWIASLICTAVKVVPLAFLWLLPNVRMTEKVMEEGDASSATSGSPYERCSGKVVAQKTDPASGV